ncbi:DNA adenine methylase [Nocardioides panacisoli]|uniref:DNA adenine methylase n=1 Tax=Nocardioides panacisoli TaxID=627624 RepID=UPI001C62B0BA|nr:DNA adenine methylase [Nocardioides panacisoli]QYJ05503.1 DNA adenine methylase [Nocardioides panacisoli]
MIKYLGSKRTLVPMLGDLAVATGARTALDLFTGTTRVAQEFKRRGLVVTAADAASYSAVLGECYISTDGATVDLDELDAVLGRLDALPGAPGYVTDTFCEQARYFQPKNGARIDAVREAIEADHPVGDPLRPVLLTALMLAADRVDSTTGLQMAYLKEWAPRAHRDMVLRRPDLLPGPGRTLHGDATLLVDEVAPVDLAYVDPPYNQHRYFTNYHVWETLMRWDAPEHYGVACKRIDSRSAETRSVFNSRRTMPAALADLLGRLRAETVVLSYNDEAWLTAEELMDMLREAGHEEVRMLAFDRKRYVGALIGIHDRSGRRVGEVRRRRNVEYVFVAGDRGRVEAATEVVPADRAG